MPRISRHAPLILAAAIAVAVIAACASGAKSRQNPLTVHDDIYTTGAANNRILLDGDLAYIVNSTDDTVDVVDLTTCTAQAHSCQRVRQILLPVGSNAYDVALADGKLWVSALVGNALYGVDLATGSVVATVSTGVGFSLHAPESFAISGSTLLISNADYQPPPDYGVGPGLISFVQGTAIVAELTTTGKIPVGFTSWPDGNIAVVNNGVADFSTGTGVASTAGSIDVIDANSQPGPSIVRTIDLGLTLPGPSLAMSSDGQFAFTGSGEGAELLRIDVATGAVQTTTFSQGPTFVSDVLVDGGVVYVLSFLEDRVYAVDANTLAPVYLNTAGEPTSFVTVGPGGATPKGPNYAVVWHHGAEKHLLVLLTLSNSMTDVVIP